jgi:outer membrane protein OmpA-like peptidoglycan-associated protein
MNVLTTAAQHRLGIIAGVGKTSLNNFPAAPEDYKRVNGSTSFWGGINADISLKKDRLSMMALFTYGRKGYNYLSQKNTGYITTANDSSFNQQLYYADASFIIKKKFAFGEGSYNNFFVGTGPGISLFLNGKETIETSVTGSPTAPTVVTNTKLEKGSAAGQYKNMYVNWNFVAGVELGLLKLWASYNLPIDHYYVDAKKNQQYKLKNIGISASITLLTIKKPEEEKKEPAPALPTAEPVKDTISDSDGDGILDYKDACPGHKGTAKYGGCPVPDSDGDGVTDDFDKCISEPGTVTNNGCPAFTDTAASAPKSRDTLRYTIYFEPGKSVLRGDAFNTLSQIVKLLKANNKLVVVFEGHTDYAGSVDANYKRSIGRAEVCANYVASFYIQKSRIKMEGYGNTRPAADLNDPLLQWKNRRVEVTIYEQ